MNTDKYFSMDDANEKALTCNLFKLQSRKTKAVRLHDVNNTPSKESSDSDIEDLNSKQYAITVNIKPTKVMNGRLWKLYTPDHQIKILTRMEKCIRSKNPSINLCELHFETCPRTRMIHFHALYLLPDSFKSVLETFWARFSGDDAKTKTPWRIFHSAEIYDDAGWLAYIRKDQDIY